MSIIMIYERKTKKKKSHPEKLYKNCVRRRDLEL